MRPRRDDRKGRVVYSTDGADDNRRRCGHEPCDGEADASPPASDQHPRVRREVKGRGGKTVTVVDDLVLPEADLKALARDLKQLCATGGTVKNGRIEIRGDHRPRIVSALRDRGFQAKTAGD